MSTYYYMSSILGTTRTVNMILLECHVNVLGVDDFHRNPAVVIGLDVYNTFGRSADNLFKMLIHDCSSDLSCREPPATRGSHENIFNC